MSVFLFLLFFLGGRELISCSDDKRGAGVAPLDARTG